MRASKILKYFQIVRRLTSSLNLAILAVFAFLLIPSHPFQQEEGHWIERVGLSDSKRSSELFQIYSVLKSQRGDLRDSWAWNISNTILEESRRHGLDPLLVLALINVESSFQSEAVSTEGARGLMQIRPIAATAVVNELVSINKGIDGGIEDSLDPSYLHPLDLDDPVLNIKLGVFYLYSLKKNFRDLKLALTAYNWGPTEVRNRLEDDEGLPLEYAMKVLSTYHSYRKDSRQSTKLP